jgi:hypothetical protein
MERLNEGTPITRLADKVKQLEEILVYVETWMNDIFRVINANAGSGLVAEKHGDLPLAAEAPGRIYYIETAFGGKHFFGSDGVAWIALD